METSFHPLDIAFALYVLAAVIIGVRRGLSRELARMCASAAILVAAWMFYPALGEKILADTRISEVKTAFGLAFALLLLGGYVLALTLGLALRALLDFKFKGSVEKVGGGLAGLLRSLILITALVLAVNLWSHGFLHGHVAERSVVGSTISKVALPFYEHLVTQYPEMRLPASQPEETKSPTPSGYGEREQH